jgi:peptide/nickel transport system ATP-binding protein
MTAAQAVRDRPADIGETVLTVENLTVVYPTPGRPLVAVDDVSLTVHRGEILGLVGESGAGKSTVGNAVARLIDSPGRIEGGAIRLAGVGDLATFTERQMCAVRGRRIGMIFQDPLTALSPVMSVGAQLARAIRLTSSLRGAAVRRRAIALLEEVGIPQPERRLRQYPHQFSGGMRQRVVIAIALAGDPGLLIADEPTTALDVSIQAEVLALIRGLAERHRAGVVLVTHDMAVISEVADRVAVMRYGRMVEAGPTAEVLSGPKADYTRALIAAVPRTDRRLDRFSLVDEAKSPSAAAAAWLAGGGAHTAAAGTPIVTVDDVSVVFETGKALRPSARRRLAAVDGVSLEIAPGETFGLVGESGSGKSTLARAICGLVRPTAGTIRYRGHDRDALDRDRRLLPIRLSMQMIFQDPFSSLHPRQRVGTLLSEPLRVNGLADGAQARKIAEGLLERVGLTAADARKLPHQFSGGQRQRICIARALATRPAFLVCDEPTSALDVSVQAQVLNLMKDLQAEFGLTILFISHDLAVVRQMCDRIAVMRQGRLCEVATADALFEAPRDDYTRHLLSRMPRFATDGR